MPQRAGSNGADQPPRNMTAAIVDSRIMFAYSPRKNIAKPIPSSYESIWAEARIAPRKAYFELEAQPATITPYTPSEVTAITYSKPALTSASTTPGANGITAQAASDGIITSTGASRYSAASA